MSDKFINQLPLATVIVGSEQVPVFQGGATVQTTAAALLTQLGSNLNVNNIIVGGVLGVDGSAGVGGNLTVTSGFGCNTKAAQAAVSVNAACTDLPTAVALLNQIRAALVADGICA